MGGTAARSSTGGSGRTDLYQKARARRAGSSFDRFSRRQIAMAMRQVEGLDSGWCWSDGRWKLMLASNNYLGLAGDTRIVEATLKALEEWGTSSSGSRLLNGTNRMHVELERRLAEFKGVEACAVFPSGYMANVGLVSALLSRDDCVVMDRLAHASLIDGARISQCRLRMFPHQDLSNLEKQLERIADESAALIVVDGIYSMDGDFCRLRDVVAVAARSGARVLVDDAHATGVAGPGGRGTADHFGMDEPDLVSGTLSKSFGASGGFVGGPADAIDFIKHNARSFVYSTSMSPATTASILAALDIVEREEYRRENLWRNTRYLRVELNRLGFDTGASESPIIPVIADCEDDALELTIGLDEDGIFASPVVYPACPAGEPRVRLSLNADHSADDLDRTLDSIARHGRRLGLIG